MVVLFIASLIPFGTIWADRRLKEEETELFGNSTLSAANPVTSEA